MRFLAAVGLAVLLAILPVKAATSGSLVLTTPDLHAGDIAHFQATVEGLPQRGGNDPYVASIELVCETPAGVVLNDYSYTMFYNTSDLGPAYEHDFTLHFTGPASCEAHLFWYHVSNNTKFIPKRTKNNTLVSVFFQVAG